MAVLTRARGASRRETRRCVATAISRWIAQSTHSSSAQNGVWQGRPSVRQWMPSLLLTRWSLSCSSLSGSGLSSSHSSQCDEDERARWTLRAKQRGGPVEIAPGPAPAVLRLWRIRLSASFGAGYFLVFSCLVRLVGSPSARVAVDESPGRTDDGRVVRY